MCACVSTANPEFRLLRTRVTGVAGVIFNDLNGDGKRTNVVGGKNNEPGVSKAAFSV